MNITNAQYVLSVDGSDDKHIKATVDGIELHIPLAPGNRHYDEIMRQVAAGTLTIADAE
jgi:hypothetical protein